MLGEMKWHVGETLGEAKYLMASMHLRIPQCKPHSNWGIHQAVHKCREGRFCLESQGRL